MDEVPLTLEGHAMRESIAQKDSLRLVETGEVPQGPQTLADALAELRRLQAVLDEAERTQGELNRKYLGALSQIGNLRADKAAEAVGHRLWPKAQNLFIEWQMVTGHTKAKWTADRFWVCQPYLDEYDEPMCRLAIYGMVATCFHKRMTPTYVRVYDEFWRAFKDADAFENHVNAGIAIVSPDIALEEASGPIR